MIKTNLPAGLTQDRKDDGTIRLTLFADIIYDREHSEVVSRLISAFHDAARAMCPHTHWEWRKGNKWCLDCEQWILAFPPLEDLERAKVGTKPHDGECMCPECVRKSQCRHEVWAWRGGPVKGTSIRYCSDCLTELPLDEEIVRQHNPFIYHCGDPKCRQCVEYGATECQP